MKYLIISKGASLAHQSSQEVLSHSLNNLKQGKEKGIVEACYGLLAGGQVWVINAESHAALASGLRRFHLSAVHDVDIYPIVDGEKALEAHLEHKMSNNY